MKAPAVQATATAFVVLFNIVGLAVWGLPYYSDFIPLLAAEIFDLQMPGRLLGVILTAGGIAEAGSPGIVGHIRDVTGKYSIAFLFLIAMSLMGSAAAAFLPERAVRP
jgi:hypothetical protein